MEDHLKNNTGNEQLGSTRGRDNGSSGGGLRNDNSGNDNLNAKRESGGDETSGDDTDKYLALEQPGVTYTPDSDPSALNSDHADQGESSRKREWNDEGGNSKYSDAFNQDDYLLEDNLDLDEDQNRSISSDDDDFEETNERY